MALTDDQKAMLRLLAQREEGYEDMAALMGISVEELRARVKEALSEVEEPAAPAEPAELPAPAPPPPPPPVEPPPVAEPRAKAAEPVSPPPSPPPEPPRQAARGSIPSPLSRLRNSKDRGALIGVGAGALVVLILVIVLIVGGESGDDSSSTTTSADGISLTAAEESKLTQAVLEPTDGSDASGRALFGRYKKNVLLQVEAEGLEPSPPGETYTIWLYRSPKLVLRIGAVRVTEKDEGNLAAQLPIPVQVLSYVAGGAFDQVDISLTSNAAYKAVLAKAKAERKLPPYTGESVLRGEISGPAIREN